MFFPNTVIAETDRTTVHNGGVKMASKVVFIRVNPTIHPIDHIAVNHIANDSIPHGSSQNTTWIVFHTTISQNINQSIFVF